MAMVNETVTTEPNQQQQQNENQRRPASQDMLTPGRIVHYVMPDGSHRPAMVVRVWDPRSGRANLQVFTDGSNDGPDFASGLWWATSVQHSQSEEPGTWHWFAGANSCSVAADAPLAPRIETPAPTGSTTATATTGAPATTGSETPTTGGGEHTAAEEA